MKYTVVIDGKPEGPFDLDDLRAMAIEPTTFIRKPGMDDFKEAHEFTELRALFGFRHQHTAPQYFAGFDQRLLSSVIDYFFLFLGYVMLILLSFIFISGKTERMTVFVVFLPVVPIAKFIYSSFAEASVKQATLGKRLLDIKVTDMAGNRIDLGVAFGRNLAKAISVFPFFFGYLYSFLNKKQQCWHDIIANTLVVKQRLI
jgi:uncharacterized RDD family membrane protein YckC